MKEQHVKQVMVLVVSRKGCQASFAPVLKKGLLNLGKHVLQKGIQVLDDVNQRDDVKVAIKKRVVEGPKKIGKKA